MKDLFSTPQPSEQFKESLKMELLHEYRAGLNRNSQNGLLRQFFSSRTNITISGVSFVMILFLAVSVSNVPFMDRGQNASIAFDDFETELSDISMSIQDDPEIESAINFEIL